MVRKRTISSIRSFASSISDSRVTALVMLVYFFSGVCSLIDEVVWVRLLKLTLGNTGRRYG